MEYIYLKNSKRAKTLCFGLSAVVLVLAIINVFLLLTGSKWGSFIKCTLTFDILVLMALLLFCMHYLWINCYDKKVEKIFYLMQLHLLMTILGLFVGDLESFSFTVIHALLEIVTMILIIELFSGKNVLVKVVLSLLVACLIMLQLNKYLSLVELVTSIIVLVSLIVSHDDNGCLIFGLLVCSVMILASILSLVFKFALVHVIMHYVIDLSALALILIVDSNRKEEVL